tara:strand:+ start:45 stop:1481 length:1437 start_codon:yes stop_codon:yes gene_type:complete
MNRTLKRPMFKMGGSTNSGIVSGLNKPRQQYSEGSKPRQQYSEGTTLERLQKAAGARDFGIEEFLIPFGLNLASATPRGNIIATAAEAAKKPASQLLQSKRAEDAFQRELGLKAEMIDIEEESKGTTLASTKKVLDNDTGNIVFATEAQIQTELSTKNPSEMKYVPVPEADKVKPVKVYDALNKKAVFVNQSDILTTTYETADGKKETRYTPIGSEDTLVKAYVKQTDGKFSLNPKFVKKKDILENPDNFEPVEGNLEMMFKVDDRKRKNKNKSEAEIQMSSALAASKIIRRLEKDIQGGAKTGTAADVVLGLTGISGFVDSFINQKKNQNPSVFSSEINEVRQYVNRLENDPTINSRLTAFLKSPETQAAKSSIVNLAYVIAKAREPGGRFSVTDIELALRSLGESANTENFLAGLKRTGEETLEFAIDNYRQHFDDVQTLDMFPRKYDQLINNYNYFRGFEVEGDGSVNPDDLDFN